MAKIFEWDARKGTFIEGVSKTAMTPTNVTFNITNKGKSAFFNGSNSVVNSNVSGTIGTGDRTIEIWFITKGTGSNSTALITDGQFLVRGSNSNNFIISNNASTGGTGYTLTVANSYKLNTWHQLIIQRATDGTITPYIDLVNVYSTESGSQTPVAGTNLIFGILQNNRKHNGDIALVRVYDTLLTEQERNRLYQEFLQSQPTEKPVRGFELVKPTDLSYLKDTGLLAAYNMKPNGSTLVDISGNSRHGTLNGGVINTKDGLGFNGVNDYVNCGNAIGYGSEMTIIGTIKPKYTSRINIIGKDNGVTRGFYVDILDTGRLRFVFSQTGSIIQYCDSVTPLGNNQKNTFAITFKGGVNSKMYINGALDKTEATALTSIFNNSLDFNIGFNVGVSNYFNGEMQDIRVYNRELTEQEIKDYHNSFIKPVILEDFSNYPVGEKRPKEWQIISGEFEIKEDTEKKYLECTSNGTIKINHNTTTDADASIDYYDGASWATFSGKLSDLITTHAWLSKEGNYLEFSLTAGQAIANIKIYDGVRQ